ncbi:MAG: 16S rRNA (uracil(1498)-N(3))-methyltransferase [Candidatus Omnitrophica bacterium]|nr:16S rRNA (uracil(1498)-N(3))-methyltransferase [Candidatus Omnitrophota bacterium]
MKIVLIQNTNTFVEAMQMRRCIKTHLIPRLLQDTGDHGAGRGDFLDKNLILVIGPEGGIIDYEIELLKAAGCQLIGLGPRILRTESVLPLLVGKLF